MTTSSTEENGTASGVGDQDDIDDDEKIWADPDSEAVVPGGLDDSTDRASTDRASTDRASTEADGAADDTTVAPSKRRRPQLIRAELLKIFTTSSWWTIGIFVLASAALSLMINLIQANGELRNAEAYASNPLDFSQVPPSQRPAADEMARLLEQDQRNGDVPAALARATAHVFTSGQTLILLFIVVLGALIVTNEYAHQTATSTFLTTPRRTRVIAAKLVTAVVVALGFWATVTAINIGVGTASFSTNGYSPPFDDPLVIRAVLMNGLAFALWALIGAGLGVLIHSQLGATITGVSLYTFSWPAALVISQTLFSYVVQEDWVLGLMLGFPGVASYVMAATAQDGLAARLPPWWVGGVVLGVYGLVAIVIGTVLTRRRDIS